MNFIKIPAGKFLMGSPESEEGRYSDETQREVEVAEFEIMDAPVTEFDWGIMRNSRGPDLPKVNISCNECQEFIDKLNEDQKEYTFRLPTEEEWEYACRAGTTTAYSFGNDPKDLKDYAWYRENSENNIHPVKQKKPNTWGLFDMHGNVWEWTSSLYDSAGSHRVVRGGSWRSNARGARSASRLNDAPGFRYANVGFRLVRVPRITSPSDPSSFGPSEAAKRARARELLRELEELLK